VTVIATGFPELDAVQGESSTVVRTPAARQLPDEPEDEGRGRIFNSLTSPRKKEEPEIAAEPAVSPAPAPTPKVEPVHSNIKTDSRPVDPIDEDDDEDWGAVPAFLRRSKLK